MIQLRPATLEDLGHMMAIGHEGLRPYVEAVGGWHEAREVQGFFDHFTPALISIIQVNGRDVGYIKTEDCGDFVSLEGIYIERAARSAGIGTRVIQGVIASTDKALQLTVFKVNPAVNLYRRLGFRVTVEDADAYTMRREPGICPIV